MIVQYVIKENTDIKSFLLNQDFSLNIINRLLLEKNNIFINDKVYNGDYKLKPNDKLKIVLEDKESSVKKVNKEIDIIFEDELFLAVNKPKGLATIPSIRHYEDNLSGRVAYYFKDKNIGIHPINRLDINTSGIVVFAKSQYMHSLVSKGKINKKYYALVEGIFSEKDGIINEKIERENLNDIKRIVSKNGKEAITKYKVISSENNKSLLDIELLTGRTHQIRVHMSHIGHPLVGDVLYNENAKNYDEFYLCAYKIRFFCSYNEKEYTFCLDKTN